MVVVGVRHCYYFDIAGLTQRRRRFSIMKTTIDHRDRQSLSDR